jgi:hypothetical protein
MSDRAAYVLSAAIILAAFLYGGVYRFGTGSRSSYRLNRFTGSVTWFGVYRDSNGLVLGSEEFQATISPSIRRQGP